METKDKAGEGTQDAPTAPAAVSPAVAAAIAEAVDTRTLPVGVAAAVELFRAKDDEETHVLWKTGGPRNSHIDELAGVLVERDGARQVFLVQAMASGKFKLFQEIREGHPGWPGVTA